MTNPILDADTRALDDLVVRLRPTDRFAEFTQRQAGDPGSGAAESTDQDVRVAPAHTASSFA